MSLVGAVVTGQERRNLLALAVYHFRHIVSVWTLCCLAIIAMHHTNGWNRRTLDLRGSACGPVIVPVFKTGGRRGTPSPVGSTPTRFRQYFSTTYIETVLGSVLECNLDSERLPARSVILPR